MAMLEMGISSRASLPGLQKLQRKSPSMFSKAHGAALLQMLTWMNTGSPRESRTPPIRTGVLRGSSSAMIGGEVIGTGPPATGATPASSAPSSDPLTGYIAYNTEYAAKMHEWEGGWGKFTEQAKDAGRKWMEKHLMADRDAFTKVIAAEFERGLNQL